MSRPEDTRLVLDHGFIRLVDSMGDDEAIVRNARVSYAANEKTGQDPEGDAKLIKYLYRNGHNTPFESVEFQFHVKAPIFVFRQWHRHRTWSYNEISARYTELPEEFYVPQVGDVGVQAKGNKQMRTTHDVVDNEVDEHETQIGDMMRESNFRSFEMYKALLAEGVPRELARTVLPVATYSEMYAKVDLSNLFKFLHERLHEHAQFEIRVYAEAIMQLIAPIVPIAVEAFQEGRK